MTVSPTPSGTETLGGSTPTHTGLHTQIKNSIDSLEGSIPQLVPRTTFNDHKDMTGGAHGMTTAGAALVAAVDITAMREFLNVTEKGGAVEIGDGQDGTWRILKTVDALEFQYMVNGVWEYKARITA